MNDRDWKPIATAPTDGTEIDVWRDGKRIPDVYCERGRWTFKRGYPVVYVVLTETPTHWMHKPPPPAGCEVAR